MRPPGLGASGQGACPQPRAGPTATHAPECLWEAYTDPTEPEGTLIPVASPSVGDAVVAQRVAFVSFLSPMSLSLPCPLKKLAYG